MNENSVEKLILKEKESNEDTPRPNLLDVINIDGRLAQVSGSRNTIKFLEDESILRYIDWNLYNFEKLNNNIKRKKFFISDLLDNNLITPKEYKTIRWDQNDDKNPEIKKNVTFFGIYKKK